MSLKRTYGMVAFSRASVILSATPTARTAGVGDEENPAAAVSLDALGDTFGDAHSELDPRWQLVTKCSVVIHGRSPGNVC